jgi:hypothetical protein
MGMGSVKRGGGSLALVYEASAPASVEEVAAHHRAGVIRDETRRNCVVGIFLILILFNKYFNINRPRKYFVSGSSFGRANPAGATK